VNARVQRSEARGHKNPTPAVAETDNSPSIFSPHHPERKIIRTEVLPMLVLSRRQSERIRLGDSIVLTIVRVSGDKVRLGIEAPPNVVVLREELQAAESAADQLVQTKKAA